MCDAYLIDANLSGAEPPHSNLFVDTVTVHGDLSIYMSGSGLGRDETNFEDAKYDDATQWPDGFLPVLAKAKMITLFLHGFVQIEAISIR